MLYNQRRTPNLTCSIFVNLWHNLLRDKSAANPYKIASESEVVQQILNKYKTYTKSDNETCKKSTTNRN